MGTLLQLELCGTDRAELRELAAGAFAEVEREEAIFSTYRAESAVTRLNRRAGMGAIAVPPDLHRILVEARRYRDLTRGTFDVTVGPLMALWQGAARPPSDVRIEQILSRVGQDKVVLAADGTVDLTREGMEIDLGGIAKGWVLDRVRDAWTGREGLESALLEFGQSSVWAIGAPPGSPAWNLALRAPDGEVLALLRLRDRALSVSATFGSSHEIEGRRYGHVVDPRTGRALERERVGAVVAADATEAEALSKALLVLAEEGIALIEEIPEAEAILFEPGRTALRTSGWDQMVSPREDSGPVKP
jgi:thiamine biosynthesis lipoprotein